jgi:hypothetical protein
MVTVLTSLFSFRLNCDKFWTIEFGWGEIDMHADRWDTYVLCMKCYLHVHIYSNGGNGNVPVAFHTATLYFSKKMVAKMKHNNNNNSYKSMQNKAVTCFSSFLS